MTFLDFCPRMSMENNTIYLWLGKFVFFFAPFLKYLNYDFFTNEYTMQLWKKKNLTAQGNLSEISLSSGKFVKNFPLTKIDQFLQNLGFFLPLLTHAKHQNSRGKFGKNYVFNFFKFPSRILVFCMLISGQKNSQFCKNRSILVSGKFLKNLLPFSKKQFFHNCIVCSFVFFS